MRDEAKLISFVDTALNDLVSRLWNGHFVVEAARLSKEDASTRYLEEYVLPAIQNIRSSLAAYRVGEAAKTFNDLVSCIRSQTVFGKLTCPEAPEEVDAILARLANMSASVTGTPHERVERYLSAFMELNPLGYINSNEGGHLEVGDLIEINRDFERMFKHLMQLNGGDLSVTELEDPVGHLIEATEIPQTGLMGQEFHEEVGVIADKAIANIEEFVGGEMTEQHKDMLHRFIEGIAGATGPQLEVSRDLEEAVSWTR
ncbi:hypothetical protein SAMN05428964_105174 [Thalassospira xiamenensis]|uniref:Uncharacterized protein n=2 Tax=Thalassospira xiamenensis TaxID=220697 RepID=A0A285TSJ9_9PROT|nr:hypothetical protein SAMN05428964_105174 [Thalassospira xiamenensis]